MRTSRISRDTARVMSAMAPSTRGAQSLRAITNSTTDGTDQNEATSDQEGIASTINGSTKKRKRTTTITTSTTPLTRRSPRKASKIGESSPSSTPKPKRQPAERIKHEDGTIHIEPPTNWEKVYSITAEMRKKVLAPVDTMGCESLAETTRSPRDQRLQTLVSLMLSSQTKDTVTAAAIRNMQENLPGGFTLQSLIDVSPEDLNNLISKVGFHNNKTKFLKSVAVILREKFDGDIPDTIEGLISLPGVGPKMAYLCMSAAWGRDEGIGVDVHVHRITNLWKWHKTSTPEQTRAELESWLPKEKWHDINHLLVGFGQTICLPVGRRCDECELSVQKLCPSAVAGSPRKRKVKKEVEIEVKDGEVKKEEVEVETDDMGAVVEVKREDVGDVVVQMAIDSVPDIEGLGAGMARRLGSSSAAVDL
ncbi:hypothetical protein DOTSEDRAFT_68994 [Dothistroma septosporum NZE10]|uniref:Endonuclease III homolog n=1 Tax=Dothistroma septosporum (strain NZE10 / CBS 128990) TaxID=675120 RepID=N1Q4L7_DOTSN|nr:hypothetical protein DOTSEDRAFT_68994 [Dothistroma septosporum NZE10]